MSATQVDGLEVATGALEAAYPPCPNQPTTPGVVVRPPSPVQLAEQFWYTVRLPVPHPASSPDYATTGKPTYLQAGDTATPPTWTRQTPLGTLAISARGTYSVVWGDGSPTSGPYDDPGGPYPTGTITHTYDNVGTVTITVEEDWTATWQIGGAHGTLAGLHTTGALPGFPIRQIQAVITN